MIAISMPMSIFWWSMGREYVHEQILVLASPAQSGVVSPTKQIRFWLGSCGGMLGGYLGSVRIKMWGMVPGEGQVCERQWCAGSLGCGGGMGERQWWAGLFGDVVRIGLDLRFYGGGKASY